MNLVIKLSKDQYSSGDIFENPFPEGHKIYKLYIYPDPKYNNDWVAALCGENEEISDKDRIIINKDIMKRRVSHGSNYCPFVTRDEAMKLLSDTLSQYNTGEGMLTFTQ